MKRLKRTRVLVLGMVVASAFMASAGSAQAEIIPAKFVKVSTAGLNWKGQLTLYNNGSSPVTCTFPEPYSSERTSTWFRMGGLAYPGIPCSGGTELQWLPEGNPVWDNDPNNMGTKLQFGDAMTGTYGDHESPYGPTWRGGFVTVPWTNATATSPSKVTFSNTVIGEVLGGVITATGTLSVYTQSGGKVMVG